MLYIQLHPSTLMQNMLQMKNGRSKLKISFRQFDIVISSYIIFAKTLTKKNEMPISGMQIVRMHIGQVTSPAGHPSKAM